MNETTYHCNGKRNEYFRNEEMNVSLEKRWQKNGKEGREISDAASTKKHLVKLHGDVAETIERKRKEGKDWNGGCEMSQQGKTVTLCPAL